MLNKIYRVTASLLNLRPRPRVEASGVLVQLKKGQAVVRLDEADVNGWWLIFADVAGDGLYVGYAASQYLAAIDIVVQPAPPIDIAPSPAPAPSPTPTPTPSHEDVHPGIDPVLANGGWNPMVPDSNIIRSSDAYYSDRGGREIRRVVIHITGTTNFNDVVSRFTTDPAHASAHYVVKPDGSLCQFISETYASHHSGIKSYVKELYENGNRNWRKFLRFFSWSRQYPADQSVFLNASMQEVSRDDSPRFVVRRDGADWPYFAYFDQRWPNENTPIGFEEDGGLPNHHSIGIEILSVGSTAKSEPHYTDAMYQTLAILVDDICTRYNIPKRRPYVVGHEDVNPVERWGWDPNQGFEWERIIDPS